MEKFTQTQPNETPQNPEKIMDAFYDKYFNFEQSDIKRISLTQLRELKEQGITTENILDYLCRKQDILLHGSIAEITDDRLLSNDDGTIFATDKAAIAILKSLYSNRGAELHYGYFINKDNPLSLKINPKLNNKFKSAEIGYIYIVNKKDFSNEPHGSWQFIRQVNEVELSAIIETEISDFKYPVEVISVA